MVFTVNSFVSFPDFVVCCVGVFLVKCVLKLNCSGMNRPVELGSGDPSLQLSGGPAPRAMIAAMEKSVARVFAVGINSPAALSSGIAPNSITHEHPRTEAARREERHRSMVPN